MFNGLKFSIIQYGVDLAKKRAQIIKDIIVKNSGQIIPLNEGKYFFIILVSMDNKPDYFITSRNIKINVIEELFKDKSESNQIELLKFILSNLYIPDFITNSLKNKTFTENSINKINLVSKYKLDNTTNFSDFNSKRKHANINTKENEKDIIDINYSKKKKYSNKKTSTENFEKDDEEHDNVIKHYKNNISNLSKNKSINSTLDSNNIIDINVLTSITSNASQTNFALKIDNNKKTKDINSNENNTTDFTSTNNTKSNRELFEEIQNQILSLKNQGKDHEIFSSHSDDEENTNIIEKESLSVQNSQVSSQVSLMFSQNSQISNLKFDKTKFAFNSGSDKINLNEHISSELEKVLEFHNNENNVFESLAYRKAIAQLKNINEKISSCDDLKKYKNFGKSIGLKIKEIILTGKLKKGDYLSNDERNTTLKILTGVWGVGMALANTLYRKGIKSIPDLRKNENLLNNNQKTGLKYYEDLQLRIPRSEIEDIFNIVKEELFTILPEEILMTELCGSYRRGKSTCGDMDIIITRKDDGNIQGILQSLVDLLMKRELITEILSLGLSSNKNQFMGICKIGNNLMRRIDIKIYKKENFPFAILYFTGSAYFNRSMRLYASKIGYSLGDFYLKSNLDGTITYCDSEEDIFSFLGIDYKLPTERDI